MNVKTIYDDGILTALLFGEIDHHTARDIRLTVDSDIEKHHPSRLILDFRRVKFMDSSGIGMILGRYKLVKMLGGNIELINVNKSIKKIFEMSGVTRIILIKSILEENLENNLENDLEKEIKEEDKNNEGII